MAISQKIVSPWAVFSICSVIIGLRFYVRLGVKRQRPTLSDVFILLSLISLFVGCVLLVALLNIFSKILEKGVLGLIAPDPDTRTKLSLAMELAYMTQILSYITLWFVKYSFIAFYFSIVSYVQKRLRILLWITTAYTIISFTVILFTWLFWCGSPSASWATPPLVCDPVVQVTPQAIATAFNTSSDLLIMLVPIFILRSLSLPSREIKALAFVFAIGSASIFASAAKGITIFVATENFKVQSSGRLITNLSAVETGAAIVAACLPTIRILVFRRDEYSVSKRKEFEHSAGRNLGSGKSCSSKGSASKDSALEESIHANDHGDPGPGGLEFQTVHIV